MADLGWLGRFLLRFLGATAVADKAGEEKGEDEEGENGERDRDGQYQRGLEHRLRV